MWRSKIEIRRNLVVLLTPFKADALKMTPWWGFRLIFCHYDMKNTVFLFVVIDGVALMAYEMKDSVGEK